MGNSYHVFRFDRGLSDENIFGVSPWLAIFNYRNINVNNIAIFKDFFPGNSMTNHMIYEVQIDLGKPL